MDKNFVEFWRNFLNSSLESQKMFSDLSAWMRQGFTGFDELSALFQRTYGLNCTSGESRDCFTMWKTAQEEFKKSLTDYLGLLGVVPLDDHVSLVKKYEELKEKAAAQEETIKNLRLLLAEENKLGHEKISGNVRQLVQDQAEQFQKLMKTFSQSFQAPEGPRQSAKAPQTEKKKRKTASKS